MGEINTPCPDSKINSRDGHVLVHSHNDATLSPQHVNITSIVSLPYPSSVSHPMNNSGAVEKLSEKSNQ